MLNANDFGKKQIIFLFTNAGEKLSFSNDNIVVKDRDGKVKHQSTCYRLFMVCVIGNISITKLGRFFITQTRKYINNKWVNTKKQEVWIFYMFNEYNV